MVMLCIDVGAHVENGEGAAAVVCGGITPVESNVRYGGVAAEGEPLSSGSPAARPPGEVPPGDTWKSIVTTGRQTRRKKKYTFFTDSTFSNHREKQQV